MLLECKTFQEERLKEIKKRIEDYITNYFKQDKNRGKELHAPKLAVLHIGDDPASKIYMNNKITAGEKAGVDVASIDLQSFAENSKKIYGEFNYSIVDNKVDYYCDLIRSISNHYDGVILQLPVPKEYTENDVNRMIGCIPPEKDVDGLTFTNKSLLHAGVSEPFHLPCTPKGIMAMLKHYNIPLEGRNVLIINRSDLVGMPLSKLMLNENATVTVAHSKTPSNKLLLCMANADIIITAVSKADFIDIDTLSKLNDLKAIEGKRLTIVDVSMNRNEEDKLCGDVVKLEDYSKYKNIDLTPVPNGVGRLTVLSLIENVVDSWVKKDR